MKHGDNISACLIRDHQRETIGAWIDAPNQDQFLKRKQEQHFMLVKLQLNSVGCNLLEKFPIPSSLLQYSVKRKKIYILYIQIK